ncbi:hypothetical protein V5O48_008820 [Marasmius crinis-equi]|uniref:Uncharacterized protein n=1 Tax=Marasmius crinis-equi TaxID=585013 RepID=A0ABR3FCW2_9AGAR
MTTPTTPQDRKKVAKKNSINSTTRARRTHVGNIEYIKAWFKKLPGVNKFRVNHEITKKNEARKEKDIKYIQGHESRPASPQQSLYTVISEDCEDFIESKDKLEKVKPYMEEGLYRELTKRRKERNGGMEDTENGLMYAPKMVEVEESSSDAIEVPFHPIFVQAINYHAKKAACLGFFLPKNLELINGNSATIKWDKVPGSSKDNKTRVWELKHIYEILKIDPEDDYEGLKGYANFTLAMTNLVRFELARGPDGSDSLYASWMLKHKNFFEQQPEVQELYDQWKPIELDLRRKRFLKGVAFSQVTYLLAWSEVKTTARSMKQMEDQIEKCMAPLREAREQNKRKEREGNGDRSNHAKRPFQGGNAGGSSDLRCFGCGGRGHTACRHNSSSHPALLWAVLKDGNLHHPTNGKLLCMRFNARGLSKSDKDGKCLDCKSEHLCSFCGKADHHGAVCPKLPKDRSEMA